MALADCRIINLPRIHNRKGNLTFLEAGRHVPFRIKRIYYLYDVPGGAERGGHAHRRLYELLIAMSGSFDVVLDDGSDKRCYHLNRSYVGLLIAPMIWRELNNFSSGSVCMAAASEYYKESDYYRQYGRYLKAVGSRKRPRKRKNSRSAKDGQ